jgi:hypothetical protein
MSNKPQHTGGENCPACKALADLGESLRTTCLDAIAAGMSGVDMMYTLTTVLALMNVSGMTSGSDADIAKATRDILHLFADKTHAMLESTGRASAIAHLENMHLAPSDEISVFDGADGAAAIAHAEVPPKSPDRSWTSGNGIADRRSGSVLSPADPKNLHRRRADLDPHDRNIARMLRLAGSDGKVH